MSFNNANIYIDGPQGSGKTTVSKLLSKEFDLNLIRGIPDGKDLKGLTRPQIWLRSHHLPQNPFVSDRSILSIWAYESRQFPMDTERIDSLAIRILKRLASTRNAIFLIMESEADKCFLNQGDGICKLENRTDVEREIAAYSRICRIMEGNAISFLTHRMNGSIEDELRNIVIKLRNL
jgi:hypothetical protein